VLAAALAPGISARAEGFSGAVEPTFTHADSTATAPGIRTTESHSDALTQRYRLSLDRGLTEFVTGSVGGALIDQQLWSDDNGIHSEAETRSSALFGRLTLGAPLLNATLGVDRREQQDPHAPTLVTQSYSANGSWRPLELPELQLRFSHTDTWDRARVIEDLSADAVQASTRYLTGGLEGRYLVDWIRSNDHLHGVQSTSLNQTAMFTDSETWLGGRTTTYLSATIQQRNVTTEVTGTGGTVTRQQLATAGLSAVLALPATPQNVTLLGNPQLIDGNTTASAAVNLGWGLAATGDVNARDVGAQFADAVTSVNTIYLWTDRPLTQDVARALAASIRVRQSKDNQTWTDVALSDLPAMKQVDTRIEITIPQTAAKYLKVTVQPLPLGLTTDTGFRDLNVTELQFFLVLPATAVPRSLTSYYVSGNAAMRTVLLRNPDLSYDFSGNFTHQTEPDRNTYAVTNGLSIRSTLRPSLVATARGDRVDTNDGLEHAGIWEWNAALVGTPLSTATWSLSYNGSLTDDHKVQNAGTAFGRAIWYEGVSSQASASGSITMQGLRVARNVQATTSTALTPNPRVALTVTALYSRSMLSDPNQGDSWSQFARVDGTLSLTPGPALSATGTVSRLLIAERPTTFASANVNWAPLRGDLQFSIGYSKSIDVQAQYTTQTFTPSLRWNVRRGVFLTTSYTLVQTSAPVQNTDSRAFTTTLLIVL
jgi:hypothetical protein